MQHLTDLRICPYSDVAAMRVWRFRVSITETARDFRWYLQPSGSASLEVIR